MDHEIILIKMIVQYRVLEVLNCSCFLQLELTGIWLVHCHLDVHLPWGLAMAFEVENGPTVSSILPPPPVDLPQC